MVRLVPMTDAEFQRYLTSAVPGFAADQVQAGNWPEDGAQELAEEQFQQLLPAGLATPDNYLWKIVDEQSGEAVGHLWLSTRQGESVSRGFVYDVEIDERFRRRGYGRRAFFALEDRARELGVTAIALHVFAHNAPARALYEQLGFTERGILMAKDLH